MPANNENADADAPAEQAVLTPQQRERLAALTADGQMSLAEALGTCADKELIRGIHQRRRQRLFQFIARSIAADIHRERPQ